MYYILSACGDLDVYGQLRFSRWHICCNMSIQSIPNMPCIFILVVCAHAAGGAAGPTWTFEVELGHKIDFCTRGCRFIELHRSEDLYM